MVRLSRLADYAVLLLSHMAAERGRIHTALDLSAATRLPAPTVSKILAIVARHELLESIRGREGGYRLARAPEAISVEEIITAVDGPIALTVCVEHGPGVCEFEPFCPSHTNWQRINDAVRDALGRVRLADLAAPCPAFAAAFSLGTPALVAGSGQTTTPQG